MNGTTLTFNLDYSCIFIVEEGEGGVGQRDWGAGGVQGRGERGEGRGEFFKGGKMGGNYTTMVNILQLKKG